MINCIQNKSFCLQNVYVLYIYYIYKNIHVHVYILKIFTYMYIHIYIMNIFNI